MKREIRIIFSFIALSFLINSCIPINETDADDAFRYWAGYKPPKEFKMIRGEFYQSPHFTTEYETYLEFKPTKKWWFKLVSQRELVIDTLAWDPVIEVPKWFKPTSCFTCYKSQKEFDRSRYFIDKKTDHCFIYETLGM